MKILVTGATGVLGREVVPRLVEIGHDVAGVARSDPGRRWLADGDVRVVEADLFDPASTRAAVNGADAVINLATAMPRLSRMARARAWALNDRLRIDGVSNLVNAAIDAGTAIFVQPSITFVYADGGTAWIDENAPVDPPFSPTETALRAEETVERMNFVGGTGIVLRLSRLYGPGRASQELVAMFRKFGGLVVGDGSNYVSSLHTADAGTGIVEALKLAGGTYNLTDDRPLTSLELTETLADAVGGRRTRRVPRWVGRLLLGSAVDLLAVSQRVSNARFREATGWAPAYPDARHGAPTLG